MNKFNGELPFAPIGHNCCPTVQKQLTIKSNMLGLDYIKHIKIYFSIIII